MNQAGRGFDREVGKLQRKLSDDTGLTPAEREFDLVIGLRLQIEDYVDRSVIFVRLRTYIHCLGVEVAGLRDFTGRTHKVVLAEQLPRTHAQLAAYHLLIEAVVTVDYHLVDTGLRSLEHAQLEVYRVAVHILFDRYELIEQITVVEIIVGHGVVIILRALVEQLLVIDRTRLDAEHAVEVVGIEHRVAHPLDVVDIIFLTLFERYIHIDGLFIVGHNGVGKYLGVAVTLLVIFLYDALQVILIVLLDKLLLLEQVEQLAVFVGFLHHSLQLVVAHHLVAVDIDFCAP